MRAFARLLSFVVASAFVGSAGAATRVTTDLIEAAFGRQGTVSRGKILFMSDGDVYLHDGVQSNLVQALGTLGNLEANVFALGTGAGPTDVVGGWRRFTDFAWVSVNGAPPVEVQYTNPFVTDDPMNPEEIAIADGCVFFGLQASVKDPDDNAFFVQTVMRVDTATGVATNLTGVAKVNGRFSRISTSQCKAVWSWWNEPYANQDPSVDPLDLHYYNGSTLTTIDTAVSLGSPVISNGRIFYTKPDGAGVRQVFMYDTTAVSPASVQLTTYVDGSVGAVVSDGRYVVWERGGLVFYPDTRLTGSTNQPAGQQLQMNRGHLFWTSTTGAYWVNSEAGTTAISVSPSTDPLTPKLGDGVLAWTALAGDGGTDREIFKHDIGSPSALPPPRAVRATPTLGSAITISFAQVLGATHNVYMGTSSGVSKGSFSQAFTNVNSPFTTPVLADGTYYFVVTAVEGGVEGVESSQVSVVLSQGQWVHAHGAWDLEFWDVKTDRQTGSTLYAAAAASGLWKSIDSGDTWSGPLSVSGDIRAVASNGSTVVAAAKNGDIFRSTNSGLTWQSVFDGEDIGEPHKVVTIDPLYPNIMFVADTMLAGATGVSNFIVKSVDGGATWTQLPNSAAGEIRAYALVGDPSVPNRFFAVGTAEPVVASDDGGASWLNREPIGGLYQSATVAPGSPSSVYVSGTTFSNGDLDGLGVYKSVDGGLYWSLKNNGLPIPLPRIYTLLADPAAPLSVHAGSVNGYYRTTDGGENWTLGSSAGTNPSASLTSIRAFAITPSRRLLAAAASGLLMSPLNPGPTVASVSPPSGSSNGGTSVTIAGTGFQAGATVRFDLAAASGVSVVNATTITAITPAHAAGSVSVTVTNPDGQAGSLSSAFTYTATAPSVPTAVVATAQTTTSVAVSWTASDGATSYEVLRKAYGGSFGVIGTPTGTSFTDTLASPSTSYLYAVTAVNSVGTSAQSASDIATTVLFSNEPLMAGVTVQAAHISQLRAAVDSVRALAGYEPFGFTDSPAAGLLIKALHLSQLRSALDEVLPLLGFPAGGYTDSSLSGVVVKAVHQQEIRDRVK